MDAKFLSVEKGNNILEIVDKHKFLGLQKNRLELHLFAAAISKFTPTTIKSKIGIVRDEQVKNNTTALPYITAIHLSNVEGNDINKLLDSDLCFSFLDECANTGYHIIESIISSERDYQGYIGDRIDKIYDSLLTDD